ncbi:hypothetical protein CSKR_113679 [Clonorchis sinensis]|uniref:Uncharacterized protein n=1 Tax=Clonorchis sinensis TaxID=79923 RepID=A0A3R7FSC1_CLOSI|nr:hypothetical protein CSKR_113679 [Clonorchis sinensis]
MNCKKYTHLQINLVYTGDSIATRFKITRYIFMKETTHKVAVEEFSATLPPHVSVATIFEMSRYVYIRNALLIRLLKTFRQPSTGFALCRVHQVGAVPLFSSTYSRNNNFDQTRKRPMNVLLTIVLWSNYPHEGKMAQWLEREFTDRKVRGSNLTPASRLFLFRLGQPDSILALVLPSVGVSAGH